MSLFRRLISLLQRGRRLLSPTCRDATRLQSEAMERELSSAQKFGLKIHLMLCRWCRRYGFQLRFMRDAIRREPARLVEQSAGELPPEARERIKRTLSNRPE